MEVSVVAAFVFAHLITMEVTVNIQTTAPLAVRMEVSVVAAFVFAHLITMEVTVNIVPCALHPV
jgi:hypothetical protein